MNKEQILKEERQRVYDYIEERLIDYETEDKELLKDLANIIFDKTN